MDSKLSIDLNNLSDTERQVISNVLKRDDDLRRRDEQRILRLKSELQWLRRRGAIRGGLDPMTSCARCRCQLGKILNRGSPCPICRAKICKSCRIYARDGVQWFCVVCHKQLEIEAATGEWMNEFVRRASRHRDRKNFVHSSDIVRETISRVTSSGHVTTRPNIQEVIIDKNGKDGYKGKTFVSPPMNQNPQRKLSLMDRRQCSPSELSLPPSPEISRSPRGESPKIPEGSPRQKSPLLKQKAVLSDHDSTEQVETCSIIAPTVAPRRRPPSGALHHPSDRSDSGIGPEVSSTPLTPRSPRTNNNSRQSSSCSDREVGGGEASLSFRTTTTESYGIHTDSISELSDSEVEPSTGIVFRKVSLKRRKRKDGRHDPGVVGAVDDPPPRESKLEFPSFVLQTDTNLIRTNSDECFWWATGGDETVAQINFLDSSLKNIGLSRSLDTFSFDCLEKDVGSPLSSSWTSGEESSQFRNGRWNNIWLDGPDFEEDFLVDCCGATNAVASDSSSDISCNVHDKIVPEGDEYRIVFISSSSSKSSGLNCGGEEGSSSPRIFVMDDCDWEPEVVNETPPPPPLPLFPPPVLPPGYSLQFDLESNYEESVANRGVDLLEDLSIELFLPDFFKFACDDKEQLTGSEIPYQEIVLNSDWSVADRGVGRLEDPCIEMFPSDEKEELTGSGIPDNEIRNVKPVAGVELTGSEISDQEILPITPIFGIIETTGSATPDLEVLTVKPAVGVELTGSGILDYESQRLRPVVGIALTGSGIPDQEILTLKPAVGIESTGCGTHDHEILKAEPVVGIELTGSGIPDQEIQLSRPVACVELTGSSTTDQQIITLKPAVSIDSTGSGLTDQEMKLSRPVVCVELTGSSTPDQQIITLKPAVSIDSTGSGLTDQEMKHSRPVVGVELTGSGIPDQEVVIVTPAVDIESTGSGIPDQEVVIVTPAVDIESTGSTIPDQEIQFLKPVPDLQKLIAQSRALRGSGVRPSGIELEVEKSSKTSILEEYYVTTLEQTAPKSNRLNRPHLLKISQCLSEPCRVDLDDTEDSEESTEDDDDDDDDDSETTAFDTDSDSTVSSTSSDEGTIYLKMTPAAVPNYSRNNLDMSLHTIVEESCEESEIDERNSRVRISDPSELERYYRYTFGAGPSGTPANPDVEFIGVVPCETPVKPEVEFIGSLPVKPEVEFIGSLPPGTPVKPEVEFVDDDYTDRSETGSCCYSETMDGDEEIIDDEEFTRLASSRLEKYFLTGFLGMETSGCNLNSNEEVEEIPFEKNDGCDTIKRKKIKSTSGLGTPEVVETRAVLETPDVDEFLPDIAKILNDDFDATIISNEPEVDSSYLGVGRNLLLDWKQQSRDSGFIGSNDDLLIRERELDDEDIQDVTTVSPSPPAVAAPPPTLSCVSSSSSIFGQFRGSSRSNRSIRSNFCTSDDEAQYIVNQLMTQIVKSMSRSPQLSRAKPPEIEVFEEELTKLMQSVPGIDATVKELVEELSSTDYCSDSYESSDYTSSDQDTQPFTFEVHKAQTFPVGFNPLRRQDSWRSSTSTTSSLDGGGQETMFIYQRFMDSLTKMAEHDVASTGSSTGSGARSPPTFTKIVTHIRDKVTSLMREVQASPEAKDRRKIVWRKPTSGSGSELSSISSTTSSMTFDSEDSPTDTEVSIDSDDPEVKELDKIEVTSGLTTPTGMVTPDSLERWNSDMTIVDDDVRFTSVHKSEPMLSLPDGSDDHDKRHSLSFDNRLSSSSGSFQQGGTGSTSSGSLYWSSKEAKRKCRSEWEMWKCGNVSGKIPDKTDLKSTSPVHVGLYQQNHGRRKHGLTTFMWRQKSGSSASLREGGTPEVIKQQIQYRSSHQLKYHWPFGSNNQKSKPVKSCLSSPESLAGVGVDSTNFEEDESDGVRLLSHRSLDQPQSSTGWSKASTLPRAAATATATATATPSDISFIPNESYLHKSNRYLLTSNKYSRLVSPNSVPVPYSCSSSSSPSTINHPELQEKQNQSIEIQPKPTPRSSTVVAATTGVVSQSLESPKFKREVRSWPDESSLTVSSDPQSRGDRRSRAPAVATIPIPTLSPIEAIKYVPNISIVEYSEKGVPRTTPSHAGSSDHESMAEEDIDRLVALHKNRSLSSLGVCSESMSSVYSAAGGGHYGNVTVRGEVEFAMGYNYVSGALEVTIKQCRDLASVDIKRSRSDPYVKVYLLPDKSKSGKRKTRVKKHTLNPSFNEVLKFNVTISELETRTLWLTVWHSDMFGRNEFLGEVTLPMGYEAFDDSSSKWYLLQERLGPPEEVFSYKGDLVVALRFVPPDVTNQKRGQRGNGSLHVLVKEARNLMAVSANGTSDPFCKCYLLPDKGKSNKQKTSVVKRSCHPKWNHTFVYEDVSLESLWERCLELTVWDYDRLTSNDFLGGVRLSLGTGKYQGKKADWMDSRGEEVSVWQTMLERPNVWVDSIVLLRPSMDHRQTSSL